MSIRLTRLRTLTLERPPSPERRAHVSAASGLVRAGDRLYVVADDENHLGIFPSSGNAPGSLARLLAGTLPGEPGERKRRKPDFESLALLPPFAGHAHGALLALGSCSTPNRCRGVLAGLDARGQLESARTEIDLAPLREGLASRIASPNIEGALKLGDELVLLQRGNRGDGRSYRVRIRFEPTIEALASRRVLDLGGLVAIDEVELGGVGAVPLCFSDGAPLADGRMAFCAIAEDTPDSYADGPCCGAAIGVLGRDGRVECLEPMDSRYKPEGIEARVEGRGVCALLVTDGDDPDVAASLIACEVGPG
jgi:hypothetical protein